MIIATQRLLFLLLCFIAASGEVSAQDKIYTTKGEVIEARVRAVSIFSVNYYAYAEGDSQLHRIPANHVERVSYEDGRTWTPRPAQAQKMHEKKELRRSQRKPYIPQGYPNVITLQFPQLHSVQGVYGIAVGVEMERFISKQGYLSLILPAYYFSGGNRGPGLGGVRYGDRFKKGSVAYIMPGVRFHPFGNKERTDLGISLSCPTGHFQVTDRYVPYSGAENTEHSYFLFGVMVGLNANFQPSQHFVLGVNMGFGTVLSETFPENRNTFQLGFRLGGRF